MLVKSRSVQIASSLVFWKTQWPVPWFGITDKSTASSVVAAVALPRCESCQLAVISRRKMGWNGSGGKDGKGGRT